MRALAYLVIGLIKPDLYASSKEGGRELSQAIHSFASTPIIFTAALAGIPFAWIVYASN